MSTTVKNPRATKKFKALLALVKNDDAAVLAWNAANPDNAIAVAEPEITAEEQALVASGFTLAQAKAALAAAASTTGTPQPEPEKLTSAQQGEVLVAKAGFIPVRGRVYSSAALIEAQVRVLRSGKPEVVKTPGEHRTKGVLVYRTDNGDGVALQNLGVQN